MKLSVGKIARMFGISRTTLLYYDNIGLLSPLERSEAGYRLYNGDDLEKLSRIKLFRDAGIPLNEVSRLLGDKEENSITAALLKQLSELNREIMAIKERQEIIVKILRSGKVVGSIRELDTEGWHEILTSAGIDVEATNKFHEDFEKHSPEQHQQFLEALGFDEEEIRIMRQRSMRGN
jgi:DNA-binding transcriptional MerR regulator